MLGFPYEGTTKKLARAIPSEVTCDNTWLTADSDLLISDCEGSEKLGAILRIVGRYNRFDALHLDSAYKSGCACFLTPDKGDITSKARALEALLGFRIFHCPADWHAAKEFLVGET